ncbi:MAG TPA: YkgJ family cysteine cluster protein, partial [Chloroflexota bacterium]|nr:YkgJ family cysteine cluster protein [Chloroflexota bacterium]
RIPTRVGECNGCGLCCRTLVLQIPRDNAVRRTPIGIQVPLPLFPNPELLKFYRARGLRVGPGTVDVPVPPDAPVEISRRDGYLVARVGHTCPQLTADGRCKIHDTSEYPRACAVFPRTPEDLVDVAERCGYRFEGETALG